MASNRTIWQEWAKRYTRLPFVKTFTKGQFKRPFSWNTFTKHAGNQYVILESGKDGRFTFVARQPREWIRVVGCEATIYKRNSSAWSGFDDELAAIQTEHLFAKHPLDALKQWIANDSVPPRDHTEMHVWGAAGDLPFLGGIIGYVSYDVARLLEKLPDHAKDDLNLPDVLAIRVDELWIWDHLEEQLTCAIHVPNRINTESEYDINRCNQLFDALVQRIDEMAELWTIWQNQAPSDFLSHQAKLNEIASWNQNQSWDIQVDQWTHLKRSFDSAGFQAAVCRIQEWIRQGDVFQVNLSVRQSCELQATAQDVYEWLRLLNPSPYMSLFHWDDFQLVSGSPELLVKTRGRKAVTRPIAGTRPRGKTQEEDLRLADELVNNEKERAEHVMLVDLERNDLGRVCKYGTVKVSELLTIERYSHVMHLVSQVEGELAAGKDSLDLLAASFPGGTITGAPKIRTMEIIETLEPVRRGPYTGSLGWIDYGGDMEMNILIRTMLCKDGQAYIQAGAGIVIDSIPEKEYQESLNKAKALWKALVCAERTEVNKR